MYERILVALDDSKSSRPGAPALPDRMGPEVSAMAAALDLR